MDPDQVERAFAVAQRVRFFRDRRTQILDPAYWCDLNPELSVTRSSPWSTGDAIPIATEPLEDWHATLRKDGYFQTPPLIPSDRLDALARGIQNVVDAGFPSLFACVYDEFYGAFAGLEGLLTPMLGAGYLMIPEGLWAFHIDTDDSEAGVHPHRDSLGPDPSIQEGGPPSLINLWLPLTEATPLNSCMYALPASRDEDYRNPGYENRGNAEVELQSIRALPARPGEVLGWSSHLLHWGSRSSPRAPHPRMSVALYFQRSDQPAFHPMAQAPGAAFGLEERLYWIADSFAEPDVFAFENPAAD